MMNSATTFLNDSAMRTFIRHPSDIPIGIETALSDHSIPEMDMLRDISIGGLSFHCHHPLALNQVIRVTLPLVDPPFITRGRVVWCSETADQQWDIGIEFLDRHDLFQIRMIEQVCHIEHYKREVLRVEGREMTGEQAALEWIHKFAAKFPGVGEPST
jgi:hypothetical protein